MNIEEVLEDNFQEKLKTKYVSYFSEKVILLTGAAGSIGQKLAILLLQTSLDTLVLVDNSESDLYDLEQTLLIKGYKNFQIQLMDITCEKAVHKLFFNYKPELVYHAAAYKHVPLLEKFPHQAFQINTIGTKRVMDNAIKYKVKDFVFISTDKAVNPKSVMGVSKRMAEIYLSQFSENKEMNVKVVRFGNIPNTKGSVLPNWEKQLRLTSKIQVVNKEMERYFISLNRVCNVLLEMGSVKGFSLFISDMGNLININELAFSFLANNKIKGGTINYTQIRPGEKKSEVLNYRDEKILKDKKNNFSKGQLVINKDSISELNKLLENHLAMDEENLRIAFSQVVPEYSKEV